MSIVVPGVARVWSQVEPYAEAWYADNLEALGRAGRRWIVLGDSLSQGIGASAHDAGWVGQLARLLVEQGYDLEILNLSATGARVSDVLDQQLPAVEEIGLREDDLVTVMVGSNDLLGGRAHRRAVPSAYAELVERVPRGAVVTSLPQPTSTARRANVPIDAAAAAGRIVLADLRVTGPTSWKGQLAADHFHPNDAGYAAIARALEPVVRAALAPS